MSTDSLRKRLNYVAVIPAGGTGSRFSAVAKAKSETASSFQPLPKQLRLINGKTVLEHSVHSFIADEDCLAIVIAAHPEHQEQIANLFKLESARVAVVPGGASRAESVFKGLQSLNADLAEQDSGYDETIWVMVHDAARPNLRQADIDKLKASIVAESQNQAESGSSLPFGAILATASQETVKQARFIEHNVIVHKTLNRDIVWQAKTPQVFRLNDLRLALEQVMGLGEAVLNVTDEAAAMERLGVQVLLVEGRSDNIKLTKQADWHLLEFVLKQK